MTIDVTHEDIAATNKSLKISCWRSYFNPICAAVRRILELPNVKISSENSFEDFLIINGTKVSLPKEAQIFSNRFELGRSVSPFSFELNYTKPESVEPIVLDKSILEKNKQC